MWLLTWKVWNKITVTRTILTIGSILSHDSACGRNRREGFDCILSWDNFSSAMVHLNCLRCDSIFTNIFPFCSCFLDWHKWDCVIHDHYKICTKNMFKQEIVNVYKNQSHDLEITSQSFEKLFHLCDILVGLNIIHFIVIQLKTRGYTQGNCATRTFVACLFARAFAFLPSFCKQLLSGFVAHCASSADVLLGTHWLDLWKKMAVNQPCQDKWSAVRPSSRSGRSRKLARRLNELLDQFPAKNTLKHRLLSSLLFLQKPSFVENIGIQDCKG